MPSGSDQDLLSDLSDVANTALATLFSRALESRSEQPLIDDPKAEQLMDRLLPSMTHNELQRSLARGELEASMQIYVALRSRYFDRCAAEFLQANPNGMIVNLGCGLDTRRWRLGTNRILDLDRPEMFELRRELLRDEAIGCDVLDSAWLDSVPKGKALILAEGLFMYLPEAKLRGLIAALAQRFAGGELVAELFSRYWLREAQKIKQRLRGQLHFGEAAKFVSGVDDSDEMERWHSGIRFIDEWSFVDEGEAKLGRLRKLRHFPRFRKRQWVVRYRFEN